MEHVLIDANTFPAAMPQRVFLLAPDRGPEFLASLGGFSDQPVLSSGLDRVI
jgi:hypothetical protein